MYLNIYLKKIAILLFVIINLLLFFPLINEYQGKIYYVILLFVLSNSYIYYSLQFSSFFLDKTLSIFLWLGFYYKLSIIFITKTTLPEGGGAFTYQPEQFDNLLTYLNVAILSLLLFSIFYKFLIQSKFQRNINIQKSEKKLIEFYKKNKKIFFTIFFILIIFVTYINFSSGFYQKGLLPKNELNLLLGYFIKWMLLFGLTAITCLLIDYEYRSHKNISIIVLVLFFLELSLTNFSILSRALVFTGSAVLFSTYINYEKINYEKKLQNSLILNFFILFLIFLLTVFQINKIRHLKTIDLAYTAKKMMIESKKKSNNLSNNNINLEKKIDKKQLELTVTEQPELKLTAKEQTQLDLTIKKLEEEGVTNKLSLKNNFMRFLFLIKYRFVGLDTLAAVTSYPDKNFNLFLRALKDEYNPNEYGFYERTFVRPYEQKKLSGKGFIRGSERQYTVITPGILSFLSYPGSLSFLFFSCGIIYIFCVSIEVLALKFSYGSLVFSNFIGYTIGYRLIHFGYLPKQSYLLFGAILATILLIKVFSLKILNSQKIELLKNGTIKSLLIQISIFSFIFFWDIKYDLYQLRYLIIIPLLLIVINFKNINYNLFLKYSLVPLFILTHFLLVNIPTGINLENRDILGIILLFAIFYVSLFYKDEIFDHLDKYIKWFIISFSILFVLFFILSDSKIILNCYNGWFYQTKFIFVENSHFALIAVPIINYYSLVFCNLKKFNKNNKVTFAFFVIFLIISFLNFSTTFLTGLILTNFYLLIFYKGNLKNKILSIIFIFASFTIVFNKSECTQRSIDSLQTLPEYFKYSILNKPNFKYRNTNFKYTSHLPHLDKVEKDKQIINMSIETFLTSLQIAFKTLKNNPFGVGFNKYQEAHKKYIDEIILLDPDIKKNNIYDGSSNISKLIAEFGIFGVIFIITFIYTTLKFKNFETKKFFLISIILLQFLRGVGYFNGGFLLLAIIYFYNYLKIREKND